MAATEAAEISMIGSGILRVRFRDGIGVEPEHAQEIVEVARRVAGEQRHGDLIDARQLHFITHEAREVFARQRRDTLSGIAILVSSLLQRSMAHLFVTVSRPRIPTRVFVDEESAVAWLRAKNGEAATRAGTGPTAAARSR